ncbi:SprT family zinc-dependent metalloprotease [Roseimaritima ulvae]|uniref:SprT-like family protein n=1 Tax=Roseimaritima ulvae TaxID=980254 RepID=A0A5B9QSP4_9BACT|nr:hypothetical protein [Roseimaritima ulvae]QEG42137.1 hypothetical protein UC8_41700 [Roseimaritima ulvae]
MTESLHSDLADYVVRKSITRKTVQQKQHQIYNDSLRLSRAMASPNFTRVGKDDLQRMAKMYDAMFFDGMLLPLAKKEGLTFGWSARMTKNAGKTVTHYPAGYRRGDPRRFEIILSSSLLFQTFSDINRPVEVTGIMCKNRLQAMQRVLEHELVHLIEMLVWDDSSCSKSPFQKIANRFFGHTQHQHDLITQRERAARKFKIGVGTHVRFDYEGQALRGVVNRITRRATVLVPDAGGAMFNDGKRYRKYYVPLEHLRRHTS